MTEYTDEQIEKMQFNVGVYMLVLGILAGIAACFIFSTVTGYGSLQYMECKNNLQGCSDAYRNVVTNQLKIMKDDLNITNFTIYPIGNG